jgi:hypothetical protein
MACLVIAEFGVACGYADGGAERIEVPTFAWWRLGLAKV